jgi:hypothetical protein
MPIWDSPIASKSNTKVPHGWQTGTGNADCDNRSINRSARESRELSGLCSQDWRERWIRRLQLIQTSPTAQIRSDQFGAQQVITTRSVGWRSLSQMPDARGGLREFHPLRRLKYFSEIKQLFWALGDWHGACIQTHREWRQRQHGIATVAQSR